MIFIYKCVRVLLILQPKSVFPLEIKIFKVGVYTCKRKTCVLVYRWITVRVSYIPSAIYNENSCLYW
jgi:hypothetical protein